MYIVYAIENIISGRKYIGSTVDPKNRKQRHFYDLWRGTHPNEYLQRSFWADNGLFEWKVLEEVTDDKDLGNREKYWISFYDTSNKERGFNLSNQSNKMSDINELPCVQRLKGSKLTTEDIDNILLFYKIGYSKTEISKIFNANIGTISNTLKNRSWSCVQREKIQEEEKLIKGSNSVGRLTIIGIPYKKFNGKRNHSYVKCKCECGNEVEVKLDYFKRRKVKSCGCLVKDRRAGKLPIKSKYRAVRLPDHPLASKNGNVFVHQKILFDKIGWGPHSCYWICGKFVDWMPGKRNIRGALITDHLDGNTHNNDSDNLVPSCHACNSGRKIKIKNNEIYIINKFSQVRAQKHICKVCKQEFIVYVSPNDNKNRGSYCSQECQSNRNNITKKIIAGFDVISYNLNDKRKNKYINYVISKEIENIYSSNSFQNKVRKRYGYLRLRSLGKHGDVSTAYDILIKAIKETREEENDWDTKLFYDHSFFNQTRNQIVSVPPMGE